MEILLSFIKPLFKEICKNIKLILRFCFGKVTKNYWLGKWPKVEHRFSDRLGWVPPATLNRHAMSLISC